MQSESTKAVTVRASQDAIAAAEKIYGAKVTGFQAAIEGFFEIYKRTLQELKGRFTEAELSAIADNMNGVGLTRQFQANSSILWAHLEDGDIYEGLFEKWGIDGDAMREKIQCLTAAEAYFLQEEAYLFWYGPEVAGLKNLSDFTQKFL